MAAASVRKMVQRRPAVTPEEIASRLSRIALKLQRKAKRGKGLDIEETRYIAAKLESYARRLQASPISSHGKGEIVFPNIQGR